MPGNGGKESYPSFPTPRGALMEEDSLEERVEALQGVVGRAVAGVENLNRCFDQLERQVGEVKRTVKQIEAQTSQIPAIKELLVEALTREG